MFTDTAITNFVFSHNFVIMWFPLFKLSFYLDNLIASSQNLMGNNEAVQQYPPTSEYSMAVPTTKMTIKSRRGRTSFTQAQLGELEAAFANTHYPDFQSRKDLSNRLKIPDDRIQVSTI